MDNPAAERIHNICNRILSTNSPQEIHLYSKEIASILSNTSTATCSTATCSTTTCTTTDTSTTTTTTTTTTDNNILQCQSCETTETPEWRRGPCGPRTLCNACGLVYAKIRKQQQQHQHQQKEKEKEQDGSQ